MKINQNVKFPSNGCGKTVLKQKKCNFKYRIEILFFYKKKCKLILHKNCFEN